MINEKRSTQFDTYKKLKEEELRGKKEVQTFLQRLPSFSALLATAAEKKMQPFNFVLIC